MGLHDRSKGALDKASQKASELGGKAKERVKEVVLRSLESIPDGDLAELVAAVGAKQTRINRLLDDFEGFLTNIKYAKLAGCSSDTALRDIGNLLERGILVRNPGGGRSTSYRMAEPDGSSEGSSRG